MAAVDLTEIETNQKPDGTIKRDHLGRYLIKGEPYTRVTTIAGILEDTYRLGRWEQKKVIKGIANRPDLLALAQAHDPDDKDDRATWETLIDDAKKAAAGGAAANLGTSLHRMTEDLDARRKKLADFPPEHQELLRRYMTLCDLKGLKFKKNHIERVVLDKENGVAGTIDRIAQLPDGRLVIADLKTSANMSWSWMKTLIQVTAYAHHTNCYHPKTDTVGKRIDVDLETAVVMHLPSNGDPAECYQLDLKVGYEYLLTALSVREMRNKVKRKTSGIVRKYEPMNAGQTNRDWITGRIMAIQVAGPEALNHLGAAWPSEVPKPLPALPTIEQIDALDAVLKQVEAAHQIPFGPSRPGAQLATVSSITKQKRNK